MKAKVTKRFEGVPDGKFYTESFAPGAVVHGDLAKTAVEGGNASPLTGKSAEDDEDDAPRGKAHTAAPKNKGR